MDQILSTHFMKQITPLFLFVAVLWLTGCNKDDPEFSSSQIQRALFDMKGTYHGSAEVSYYHGAEISSIDECTMVSRDSMTFYMDLAPVAETIEDDEIAARLREIGTVAVKAGYEFLQMDPGWLHFVLHPDDVVVRGGNDMPKGIRIVFAQTFGGDAETYRQWMMFNVSPIELWVGDERYEPFKQLVYHFSGEYE